jgi:hypothetical protein
MAWCTKQRGILQLKDGLTRLVVLFVVLKFFSCFLAFYVKILVFHCIAKVQIFLRGFAIPSDHVPEGTECGHPFARN